MPEEGESVLHARLAVFIIFNSRNAELLLLKWICVLLEHRLFTDVNVKAEV